MYEPSVIDEPPVIDEPDGIGALAVTEEPRPPASDVRNYINLDAATRSDLGSDVEPEGVTTQAAAKFTDQVTVWRIPSTYTAGEVVLKNLTGLIAVVEDITKVKVNVTSSSSYVECEGIYPSPARNNCFDAAGVGWRFNCATMYGPGSWLARYQDPRGRPYTDLMPTQNAIQVAADSITSTQHALAINLGFFETQSFTNRPAEGPDWKGTYQESCSTIAGVHTADGVTFTGKWKNRHYNGGRPDKPLTTLIVAPSGVLYLYHDNEDAEKWVRKGDRAFSGVMIRRLGVDISRDSGEWPQFVINKADAVVGRTAIGFSPTGKFVKIVVIQAGNGVTRTDVKGATIGTVRNMFKKSDYPYVFLLDGSGSSQMATSLPPRTDSGIVKARIRTDCVTTEVKTCSWWGDTVTDKFVSHYHSQWTPANNETLATGDSWVDRRSPAMLVLSGPK